VRTLIPHCRCSHSTPTAFPTCLDVCKEAGHNPTQSRAFESNVTPGHWSKHCTLSVPRYTKTEHCPLPKTHASQWQVKAQPQLVFKVCVPAEHAGKKTLGPLPGAYLKQCHCRASTKALHSKCVSARHAGKKELRPLPEA